MAYTVVWSHTAVTDLRAVVQYVAQDNPVAAEALAHQIFGRIDLAAAFPYAHRPVPEFGDKNIREALWNPYRIVYALNAEEQEITILRVWHAARGEPGLNSD